jgi:hypothetical protein
MIGNLGIRTVAVRAMTFLTTPGIGFFLTDARVAAADALRSYFPTLRGHAFG